MPDALGPAQVGTAGRGLSAGGPDLLRRGLRPVAVDIGEQQVRALGGEAAADLAADPAPAAGDDRAFPVEPRVRLIASFPRCGPAYRLALTGVNPRDPPGAGLSCGALQGGKGTRAQETHMRLAGKTAIVTGIALTIDGGVSCGLVAA